MIRGSTARHEKMAMREAHEMGDVARELAPWSA